MRNLSNLRFLVIFVVFVLIIGCRQQPIEELPLLPHPDNQKRKPIKKVKFVDTPELIPRASDESRPQSKEALQPQAEKGTSSFQDTTVNKYRGQKAFPPPLPVPPDPKIKELEVRESQDQQDLPPVPSVTPNPEENQEQGGLPPPILLPPPVIDQSQKDFPLPPPPLDEKSETPKKEFPTIDKLSKDLGVDILSMSQVTEEKDIEATLGKKDASTLENEFKSIQQAYEVVKQAFEATDITQDAKSRLNEEAFQLNKARRKYYDFVKKQIEKQKKDLLADAAGKLPVKQGELEKLKQDIKNTEATIQGLDLSTKISAVQAELTNLDNEKPKFSKFKDNLLGFNQAKRESEDNIEKKEKELKNLRQQENSIMQQLKSQTLKSSNLEREIARLKEEPKKIEERFNKQIQDLEDTFKQTKQANSGEKYLLGSLLGNMSSRIHQIQQEEETDEGWDD